MGKPHLAGRRCFHAVSTARAAPDTIHHATSRLSPPSFTVSSHSRTYRRNGGESISPQVEALQGGHETDNRRQLCHAV